MADVIIVNERDEPIGSAPVKEAVKEELLRRVSRVFIFDGNGQMLLQRRSDQVTNYPLLWDQAVGGHVDVGETYWEAAEREMGEELGIMLELEEVAVSHFRGVVFNGIYKAITPVTTDFAPDPREVNELRWLPIDIFEKDIVTNAGAYVPPFVRIWNDFRDKLAK